VDVNIHPQKTEIRLDNELVICEFIQNEVKKALLSSDLITAADLKLNQSAATLPLIKDEAECSSLKEINEAGAAGKTEHSSLNGKRGNGVAEKPDIENYDHGSEDDFIADMEPPSGFFLSEPTPLSKISASVGASVIKDSAVSLPHVPVTVSQPATSEYSAAVTLPLQKPSVLLKPESEPVSSSNPGRADDNITPVEKTEKKTLENYRIIGQFANSFIVIEQKDRLLLVDQHVAQETVLFTRIYRGLQNPATGFATQNLLKPLPLSLSAFYSAILSEHEQMLNRVGFSFVKEESGYFLKGTPPMLGVGFDEAAFTDILARLADLPCGNALEKRHREMAAVMACKGSIKAGRRLNQVECEELLKQLSATENPFFCPHGRPVIISFDLGDILQRFGRNRSARIFGETGQS
jgi:DNA mismatch repair protein MutL